MVTKAMIDEGVLPMCAELLKNMNDLECIRYVCGLVSKICKHSCKKMSRNEM